MKAAAITALMLVYYAQWGFVTMKVWNWFVPGGLGLCELSFGYAVGLVLLSACLHRHGPRKNPTDFDEPGYQTETLLHIFVSPWLTLLVAWAAKATLL